MGMLLDSRYAVEIGMLAAADFERVRTVLVDLGLPRWDERLAQPGAQGRPAVLEGLEDFREHLVGELTVTLLRGIGQGVEVNEMDEGAILRSLAWMRENAGR